MDRVIDINFGVTLAATQAALKHIEERRSHYLDRLGRRGACSCARLVAYSLRKAP